MNLEELKKTADFNQRLLIENVERLVRGEYQKEKLLEEVKEEFWKYIQNVPSDIMKKWYVITDYESSPWGWQYKEIFEELKKYIWDFFNDKK